MDAKGYSIELPFARESGEALAGKLSEVEGPWRKEAFSPHLSLAVIREPVSEVEILRLIVKEFSRRNPPFRIRLSSLGVFPGKRPVLTVMPAIHEKLMGRASLDIRSTGPGRDPSDLLLSETQLVPACHHHDGQTQGRSVVGDGGAVPGVVAGRICPRRGRARRISSRGQTGAIGFGLRGKETHLNTAISSIRPSKLLELSPLPPKKMVVRSSRKFGGRGGGYFLLAVQEDGDVLPFARKF